MSEAATTEPVDLTHLDKYTGGDARVNEEVFQLFSQHCAEVLRLLARSLNAPKAWREAAHSLKGAAAGIGAFDLAQAAGDAEGIDPEAAPGRATDALRALDERSEVVRTFIETYLAL